MMRATGPVFAEAGGAVVSSRWLAGWMSTLMMVSLSRRWCSAARAWSRTAFAHPGQMAGIAR